MTEKKFQEVVKAYRETSGLSVRGFAGALKEKFMDTKLSGMTISRWENTPNAAPDLYFLLNCIATYEDWRAAFAADSLRAVLPHVFDSGMVVINLSKGK